MPSHSGRNPVVSSSSPRSYRVYAKPAQPTLAPPSPTVPARSLQRPRRPPPPPPQPSPPPQSRLPQLPPSKSLTADTRTPATMPPVDSAAIVDPATLNNNPFEEYENPSYSSIDSLLDALANSRLDDRLGKPAASNRSESPLPLSPVDDETGSSASSSLANPPDAVPTVSKRVHALLELLSSERAYASDLALIRDIHIPLALGQQVPFQNTAAPAPPSSSSSRTVSTASDSSSSASSASTPPMSREDTRIIFSNVPELALFADMFTEQLEQALGSVLEGGQGPDRVGKLFLDIIPLLEPAYKLYITRHPIAVAHLNALPQTSALTAYLAHTRTLAASLTHAWDLPSLLIKPVQRLLKYPLLLAAIIEETPDSHEDKDNLRLAKEQMEEVARSVNEDRRRWEVVQEVLTGKPGELAKKKGLNVGVAASVNITRMKSLRSVKAKNGSEEALQVEGMAKHLKATDAFVNSFAKAAIAWAASARNSIERLRDWGLSLAKVIGLSEDQRSESFDAFLEVLQTQLLPLSADVEKILKDKLLRELARLIATTEAPTRLIDAMNSLEPQHYALLNINIAKNRPPALLEASQSYLALRGQLYAELPRYLTLLHRGIMLSIYQLAQIQARFYADVRDRWSNLWDALRVEGEMNAGASETLRVWWGRWGDADKAMLGLRIVFPLKRTQVETTGHVASLLSSLEPSRVSAPMSLSASSSSSQAYQQYPHQRNHSHGSRGTGSDSASRSEMMRRYSNESLHSRKSSSNKSGPRSRPDDYLEFVPDGSGSAPMPVSTPSARMRNMSGGMSMPAPYSARSPEYESHYDHPPAESWEQERGRIPRKPSLRRKLTDTLLPTGSNRRRSSSVKSMDSSTLPREQRVEPSPQHPSRTTPSRSAMNWAQARPKYACRVIHPCYPPLGVTYNRHPFFELEVGDIFEVLLEAGHPCTHENLPLYVDDGEDCLLLVRDRSGRVGWALASFMMPED